ncbi:MAG: cytidylate kinase-like family protein [Bacteroidales bacterium]|nr:cytidylate kinase-like family protein [Bacteroidales bacterium]
MSDPKFVIVIGRQYGSGGRKLGKRLSERLGVAYYDKELLSEAASRLGFRADLLEKADERPPSPLRSMLGANLGSSTWFTSGAMHSDTIYKVQSDVIRAIAEQGSCVIVGRTADYILRDHPGLLSIFLHADIEDRVKEVMTNEAPDKSYREVREQIEKRDADRKAYYNNYTGRNWGVASNYHLTLSSSRLPLEAIEELILSALRTSIPLSAD